MSDPNQDNLSTVTGAQTEAGAAFAAALTTHEPTDFDIERGDGESAKLVLIPSGMMPVDPLPYLDARREFPVRAKGTSTHDTLDSLVAHVARNKREHSAVAWLKQEPGKTTLTVVYNYHSPHRDGADGLVVDPDGSAAGMADWCDHRAVFNFPLSDAWKAWAQFDGKPMSQADFALFLEARAVELAEPSSAGPSAMALARALFDADAEEDAVTDEQAQKMIASPKRLLKLSRRLSLTVEARAKEERDRHGNVSIVYTENVSQENPDGTKADEFSRPAMFLVRVPVYQDGTEYTLPVRVETKVAGGKVQWTYRFHRPDKAALDAQNDIAKAFAERTGLAVFRGSME